MDQEKLALEMLRSVENIKNNSLAAQNILLKDNKVNYLFFKNILFKF